MEKLKSLYIHIPFCRRKCSYCDFYSIVEYKDSLAASYIEILSSQINKLEADFLTFYIGGGTPTVLKLPCLKKLLKNLRKISKKLVEFTIEANPESLSKDKIKLFLDEGVNRLSIGVQSLSQDKLRKIGRIHNVKEAREAVRLAKNLGFDNISIDLIFGVWEEKLKEWERELRQAVELPITHISSYSLTYENNTFLFKEVKKGKIKPLDDEAAAGMYSYTMEYLPKRGFCQYEVSNFSKKGYPCQHNLSYWQNNAYVGLGPCAVSYIKGVREKNISNIEEYIQRVKKGRSAVVSCEKLSLLRRAKEAAALKIRTKEGIIFQEFKKASSFDLLKMERENIDNLIKQDLVAWLKRGGRRTGICLTKKGFLFSDTVSASLL